MLFMSLRAQFRHMTPRRPEQAQHCSHLSGEHGVRQPVVLANLNLSGAHWQLNAQFRHPKTAQHPHDPWLWNICLSQTDRPGHYQLLSHLHQGQVRAHLSPLGDANHDHVEVAQQVISQMLGCEPRLRATLARLAIRQQMWQHNGLAHLSSSRGFLWPAWPEHADILGRSGVDRYLLAQLRIWSHPEPQVRETASMWLADGTLSPEEALHAAHLSLS
jgi:hypothetical protein